MAMMRQSPAAGGRVSERCFIQDHLTSWLPSIRRPRGRRSRGVGWLSRVTHTDSTGSKQRLSGGSAREEGILGSLFVPWEYHSRQVPAPRIRRQLQSIHLPLCRLDPGCSTSSQVVPTSGTGPWPSQTPIHGSDLVDHGPWATTHPAAAVHLQGYRGRRHHALYRGTPLLP